MKMDRLLYSVAIGVVGGGASLIFVVVLAGLLASPLGRGVELSQPYRVFYYFIMPVVCFLSSTGYSYYRLAEAQPNEGPPPPAQD